MPMPMPAESGSAIHPLDPGSGWFAGVDRALIIADERLTPSNDSLPALADPTLDHEDRELAERRADIDAKHRQIAEWLDANGYDALVLGRTDSLSWFTSGGDLGQSMTSEQGSVLLFINRIARAIVTDNVHSARVFDEEVAGLGFQVKERDWYLDPRTFVAELGHNKKVATDNGLFGWPNEMAKLRPLRLSFTKVERQRYRELGRTLSREVEATCRNFARGENEAAVAGHLAHRLMRLGVVPLDIRVAGDERLARYRQATFKRSRIDDCAVITCTGRRHGLCATISRTVSFGPAPDSLKRAHALASMVDATAIFFSRPGTAVNEIYPKFRRIYEKFGHGPEWTKDYQGVILGYLPREMMLMPESPWQLPSGLPISWSSSVGSARSQDTVVIDERGYEVVTAAQNWPKVEVLVKGVSFTRPGILQR